MFLEVIDVALCVQQGLGDGKHSSNEPHVFLAVITEFLFSDLRTQHCQAMAMNGDSICSSFIYVINMDYMELKVRTEQLFFRHASSLNLKLAHCSFQPLFGR